MRNAALWNNWGVWYTLSITLQPEMNWSWGGGRGDQDRNEEYRQRSLSNGWEINGCDRGKASYTIG